MQANDRINEIHEAVYEAMKIGRKSKTFFLKDVKFLIGRIAELESENKQLKDLLREARNCETGCYGDELREVEKESAELRKQLEMAIEDVRKCCSTCGNLKTYKCPGAKCYLEGRHGYWQWRGAKESEE